MGQHGQACWGARHERCTGVVTYRFPTPNGYVERCGMCALVYPPLVENALKTAAFIGNILTLINHGAALAHGTMGG